VSQKSILVVEDEQAIVRVLSAYLKKAGYIVELADNGLDALEKFETFQPTLVLLDVMLPGLDGWSVLKRIREKSTCPVIMLTACGEIEDRLTGFNEGADDYIPKPFIPEEVVARVHAVLRRPTQWMEGQNKRYFGSLQIDFTAHRVYLNGVEASFTPRDVSLLLFLAQHPNRTFTRAELIDRVWGIDYDGSDRAVDLSVKRIRQTLANWPASEGEIRTLRGMGYQFWVGE